MSALGRAINHIQLQRHVVLDIGSACAAVSLICWLYLLSCFIIMHLLAVFKKSSLQSHVTCET